MPANRQKTRVLISLSYGLACLALLAVALVTWSSSKRFIESANRFETASKEIMLANEIEGLLTKADSDLTSYVVTNEVSHLRAYNNDAVQFQTDTRKLTESLSDNPNLKETVSKVNKLGLKRLYQLNDVVDAFRSEGLNAAVRQMRSGTRTDLMANVREQISQLRTSLQKHFSQLAAENEANRSASQVWLIGGMVIAVLAVVAAALLLLSDLSSRLYIESSLQRVNAMQAAIFDSVGTAIIATDEDGKITVFNRTAEEWLGYSSKEVIGHVTPMIFHDSAEVAQKAEMLSKELGRNITPGFDVLVAKIAKGGFDSNEWIYLTKDRSSIPIMLTVSAMKDPSGQLLGYVGLASDLTDQKKTEATLATYVAEIEAANQLAYQQNRELKRRADELKESRDSAVAATRMKSEFLANMSHEIRTPMNGVIGMAHLLLNTPLTEKQQGYARTIRESAESLLAILNDILDLSKMEAGKMTLENFPFDLRLMIEDLCDVMAPTAHSRGLELNCEIPQAMTSRVIGDPSRLRQVLTNLLGNAIKFTEKGEVSVQVKVLKDNPKRVTYRLAVKDTGIGIEPERQQKIFESFTQADGTTTRKFGGTGLGLTISKQLSELMGGELGVTSAVGQGSEFWLEIAFQKQPLPKVELEEIQQDLSNIRVLVADDSTTNRFILREMLQSWNCRVEEATSGKEAISTLTLSGTDAFSAVIMDLHMPGMDGLQVAKTIKRDTRYKDIPLILLSSSGFTPADTESASLYTAVLSKPVRSQPLYNALSQVAGIQSGIAPEVKEVVEPTGQLLKGVRILVVEDNPVNQMVVCELLDIWGCTVVTANNGLMAVDATAKEKFDAILMDVMMPVMDGFEATAAIRTQEKLTQTHTEIIAMTANAMTGDKERCLKAGMDTYLSKPLQPAMLLERLAAATGRALGEAPVAEKPEPKAEWVFDLARLDESCSGSDALKQRVIDRYLVTSVDSCKQIVGAVESQDGKGLKASAHALKGSSLTIGANTVGQLCQELEICGTSEDFGEETQAKMTSLNEQLELLLDDLKHYSENLKKGGA